jgi:colanic acid/amylovoran biosynthesis glycosyltransferase
MQKSLPEIRTLHLLESYLDIAQNWTFRMLDNLPRTKSFVAAYQYENPQFLNDKIERIPLPDYISKKMLEGNDNSNWATRFFLNRFTNLSGNRKYFRQIANFCRDNKIELIHCHFANIGWHFLDLKKMTGLPFVVSFYGFDYQSLPMTYPKWKNRYRQLFKTVDNIFCEGEHGASILEKQGCPQSKIQIIKLGVETGKVQLQQRIKKPGELSLLQVSGYREKKGQIYTLKSFISALQTCPNMTLTLVGNNLDKFKKENAELFSDSKLKGKLTLLDFIDFKKLYDLFASYQVFIHPSCHAANHDCEGGAPVVILDAECTGMPVISTTHCDIPSEVIHKKTGLLTPEKDVVQLTESIRYFYNMDNDEYQKFSVAARQHVEKEFDIKPNAEYLEKKYREILNKN